MVHKGKKYKVIRNSVLQSRRTGVSDMVENPSGYVEIQDHGIATITVSCHVQQTGRYIKSLYRLYYYLHISHFNRPFRISQAFRQCSYAHQKRLNKGNGRRKKKKKYNSHDSSSRRYVGCCDPLLLFIVSFMTSKEKGVRRREGMKGVGTMGRGHDLPIRFF